MPISRFMDISGKQISMPSAARSLGLRRRQIFEDAGCRRISRWVSLILSHLTSRELRGRKIGRPSSVGQADRGGQDEPARVGVEDEEDQPGTGQTSLILPRKLRAIWS